MTTTHHVLSLTVTLALAAPAFAAEETRQTLKTYFETGDIPTDQQFYSLTGPGGLPSPIDPPDIRFLRGSGSTHSMLGLAGTEFFTDGSGHPLFLSVGDRPTAGQFGTLIDSALCIPDDRYYIGLRFTRSDGVHYGFMDISIDSPLPGFPGDYALTIHGWAFETEPNTPITVFAIPAPGAGALLGLSATAATRRRRR